MAVDMDFGFVVKIKYGDTLRRFNGFVNGGVMDIDMASLRSKILSSFKFSEDALITLSYVDEDKDVVVLVDDSDLQDAVLVQRLNPLRISVTVNEPSALTAPPSESATPLRSTEAQKLPTFVNANIEDSLKTFPEPLREALSKLSNEFLSKASSSSPLLNEMLSSLGTYFGGLEGRVPAAGNPSCRRDSISRENGFETRPDHSSPSIVHPKTADISGQAEKKRGENAVSSENLSFPTGLASSSLPPAVQATGSNHVVEGVKTSGIFSGIANPMMLIDGVSRAGCPAKNWKPPVFSGALPYCPAYSEPGRRRGRWNTHPVKSHLPHHRGVECDGCGMHPIVGPRFKSKVKDNYDLCDVCFMEMGNVADYFQIDHPSHYSGLFSPARSHHYKHCHMGRSHKSKLESRFVKDVTVLDGTIISPGTAFTKIWRMRNDGNVPWPPRTQLVWIGGDLLGASVSVELEVPSNGCGVDEELDVAVEFHAPLLPGRYMSYWKLASPDGQKFGQRVWVLIHVVNSLESDLVLAGAYAPLNLNVSPESSINFPSGNTNLQKGKAIIDAELGKSADLEQTAATNAEQVGADIENFNNKQKVQIDGNNETFKGVSYPIIDQSDLSVPVVSAPELPVVDVPDESALLKELEEMGFKQVDVNKEVLRKNDYDLENSLDELCAVSEWDPLLEELQEMGFVDRLMNKKLLAKNNGSLKRVVLDLIAEERK